MNSIIDGAQQLANAFHGQKVVRRTVRGCLSRHRTMLAMTCMIPEMYAN